MTTINIYTGKNVQLLQFQQTNQTPGFTDNKVNISMVNDTYRVIPEAGIHPSVFAERMLRDMERVVGDWNMHISTHSDVMINILGGLIDAGHINHEDVKIFLLSDDNSHIIGTSGFDSEGYLDNGWYCGFLDWDCDILKTFKVKK